MKEKGDVKVLEIRRLFKRLPTGPCNRVDESTMQIRHRVTNIRYFELIFAFFLCFFFRAILFFFPVNLETSFFQTGITINFWTRIVLHSNTFIFHCVKWNRKRRMCINETHSFYVDDISSYKWQKIGCNRDHRKWHYKITYGALPSSPVTGTNFNGMG